MTKLLFVILLFIFPCLSFSQSPDLVKDMENDFLQIRQKSGTDSLLADYISKCHVNEDTVYAYIYVPGNCPRCEAPFKFFKKKLNENGKKFMLISVFKDSVASKYHNEEKGYAADYYLYDTDNSYKRIFSFNNIDLDGSSVLKFTREGRLITGGSPLVNSGEFVKQLIERSTPMDYKTYESADANAYTNKMSIPNLDTLKCGYTDYAVKSSVPLCRNTRNMFFNDEEFFYADDIINGVLLFKTSAAKKNVFELNSIFKVDSIQKRTFVSISDELYDDYLKAGMVFDIVCNVNMIDSSNIGISYSLPRILYQNNDTTSVAYYNQPCILKCPIDGEGNNSIIPLEFNLYKDDYFYKHFQYCSAGDRIVLGCQKLTWPMEYERDEYAEDIERNSFDSRFYKTATPFLAVADVHTGKIVQRFGHLDESAEKGLTGYYFVNPISMVCGSELIYTDGYSGKVYVADTSDVATEKACYTAFNLNYDFMPPIDSTKFYTYEYVKPYWAFYNRCIMDIRATDEAIYCIVNYESDETRRSGEPVCTLIVVDRKTGLNTEGRFPAYEGYETWGCGLRMENAKIVSPFEVLKKDNNVIIRVLSLPSFPAVGK